MSLNSWKSEFYVDLRKVKDATTTQRLASDIKMMSGLLRVNLNKHRCSVESRQYGPKVTTHVTDDLTNRGFGVRFMHGQSNTCKAHFRRDLTTEEVICPDGTSKRRWVDVATSKLCGGCPIFLKCGVRCSSIGGSDTEAVNHNSPFAKFDYWQDTSDKTIQEIIDHLTAATSPTNL